MFNKLYFFKKEYYYANLNFEGCFRTKDFMVFSSKTFN